jgi:nicotinamide phosphoribosyltransferase
MLVKTSDVELDFSRLMIYGFGQRSASSHESCVLGGAAFLQFFEHTDIIGAHEWLQSAYPDFRNREAPKAFSLDHGRYLLFEKTIIENPQEFLSSVFNQYDIFSIPVDATSLTEVEGALRAMVQDVPFGKRLILRWDGSQFERIIPRLIEILKVAGPPRANGKGYLSWNRNLYLMFTEDMTLERVETVLNTVTQLGYTVDQLIFGIGTQMIQNVTRDDYGVVGKITAAYDGEKWFDVEKKSHDQPEKRGLAGRLSLTQEQGRWRNERIDSSQDFTLVFDGTI